MVISRICTFTRLVIGADWAAWLPCTCQVGRLSNVEIGHKTYPVNRRRVRMKGRERVEGQSHKEEEREGGSGNGKGVQGPLAMEGGLYLDI